MFLEFLRQTLIDAGVSVPIFIDFAPPEPDEMMLVRSMQGRMPEQGHEYDMPGFQVLCRSKVHNVARSEVFKAFKALHDAPNMRSTDVVDIYAVHSPYLAGQDDLGRYVYVQNYHSEIVRE